MAADPVLSEPTVAPAVPAVAVEERLERGDIVRWPACPFDLPGEDDRLFLFQQRLGSQRHKNISYDPLTGLAHGFRWCDACQAERLHRILATFSSSASRWLADALPGYAAHWALDRASYRPDEEAVRRLRWKARDDLLHIDAFPTRPTHGARILRLFVNLNPSDDRAWVTSETFAALLQRYGREVGLPGPDGLGLMQRWRLEVRNWLRSGTGRSPYDDFMLRFHDYLKSNDEFQERSPKRYWTFPPGSAWLLFSDGLSYGDLRGQYALEHSFFIAPQSLTVPDQAPAALIERLSRRPLLGRAA